MAGGTAARVTTPDEQTVAAKAEGFDYPVILCGHTHIPRAVRLRDGRLIVNPGSVGLQVNHGSPDARYATIELRGRQVLPVVPRRSLRPLRRRAPRPRPMAFRSGVRR